METKSKRKIDDPECSNSKVKDNKPPAKKAATAGTIYSDCEEFQKATVDVLTVNGKEIMLPMDSHQLNREAGNDDTGAYCTPTKQEVLEEYCSNIWKMYEQSSSLNCIVIPNLETKQHVMGALKCANFSYRTFLDWFDSKRKGHSQIIIDLNHEVLDHLQVNAILARKQKIKCMIVIVSSVIQNCLPMYRLLDFAPESRKSMLFRFDKYYLSIFQISIPMIESDLQIQLLRDLCLHQITFTSKSKLIEKKKLTIVENFMLQLFYSNIITWDYSKIEIISFKAKSIIFEFLLSKGDLWVLKAEFEIAAMQLLNFEDIGDIKTAKKYSSNFINALEEYLNEWVKTKYSLNVVTLKAEIYHLLHNIQNGVNLEFGIRKGKARTNSYDLKYEQDECALLVKMNRSQTQNTEISEDFIKTHCNYVRKFKNKLKQCYLIIDAVGDENIHFSSIFLLAYKINGKAVVISV